MAITAAMVKDLREMTGAGMMDCKKALAETDGDMDKAVEFLREKGLAAAEKKAGRIAAEGISYATVNEEGKIAAIVEVNSETDFVAKNEKFREYVAAVAEQVKKTSAADIDAFLAEPWELDPAKTVKEELSSQIAIIGENMNIRRFEKVVAENGFVEAYIHGGGRIGVLIEMDSAVYNDGAREVAKNLAMQVAALNPKYVNESEIPADYIAHEREIIKAQTLNENTGKPENIIEKMIDGRQLKLQNRWVCNRRFQVKAQYLENAVFSMVANDF